MPEKEKKEQHLLNLIKSQMGKGLQIIPDFDLLTGCSTLYFDMVCVTNNRKHLSHIPNLKIEDWTL